MSNIPSLTLLGGKFSMKTILYRTRGNDDKEKYTTEVEHLNLEQDVEGVESYVVNLYPELKFDTFEAFGGAITDSAAYVYSLMNEEQKKEVIDTYFSKEQMNYRIVRIHMDSCDFSTEMYEAMSDPDDKELKSFSFERTEKYILPMLEDAQKVSGNKLKLMLSPWTPPAFMKTNQQRKHGGSIRPEYRKMWAEYICRYIEEFQKRGFEVQRISLQNEPKAVQTWDSCVYTAAEEKEFLKDYMYPALKAHGMEQIQIFIWDHNKERAYERAREIIDETTAHMVAGVACHWYSGDHFENLNHIRIKYPNLKLIISESCIEYSKFDAADEKINAGRLSHEIIGDLNHGMSAFYDWNLLLDEEGGPNHVGNLCQAPFLFDTKQKVLMPQLLQKHLNHFSHFIKEGARRIGFSRYTEALDVTSFINPDGKIVYILLNRSQHNLPVILRIEDQIVKFEIQSGEVITGVIEK